MQIVCQIQWALYSVIGKVTLDAWRKGIKVHNAMADAQSRTHRRPVQTLGEQVGLLDDSGAGQNKMKLI